MKCHFLLIPIFILFIVVMSAFGTPLRLDYYVEPLTSGPGFNYEFNLVLDDNDNSWSPGQGWGWIVFGDSSVSPSPLEGFAGDVNDLPIGPYTGYGSTFGGHNGPNLDSVLEIWTPVGIGDSLSWSGTSTGMVSEPNMFFSTLLVDGAGTVAADFDGANRLNQPPGAVPESATLLLVGMGIIGLVGIRKRKIK